MTDKPNTLPANLMAQIGAAIHALTTLQATLKTSVEGAVKCPVNTGDTRDEILAARRRAHAPGTPSKIDTDPELRAFIIARLGTHTFGQIRDEITAHFPPDRRTSLSALSRWWIRRGQNLTAQPQDTG